MKFNPHNLLASASMIAMSPSICFITANPDGSITPSGEALSFVAGQEGATEAKGNIVVGADDLVKTPEELEAARKAAEEGPKEEPPKDPAAEEPKEKTTEELEADKVAALEVANKEWTERDTAKDVPLTPEQAAEIAAKPGLTDEQRAFMTEATLQTNTAGKLTPAAIAQAAKLWNVSEDMVERYVAGVTQQNAKVPKAGEEAPKGEELTEAQKLAVEATVKAAHETLGSEENWKDFLGWAQGEGGLTGDQLADLAKSLDASPQAGVRAIKEYLPAYTKATQGGPKLDLTRFTGQGAPKAEVKVKGFESREAQNEALRKTGPNGRPLMETDEKYRKEVEARIVATTFTSGPTGLL